MQIGILRLSLQQYRELSSHYERHIVLTGEQHLPRIDTIIVREHGCGVQFLVAKRRSQSRTRARKNR